MYDINKIKKEIKQLNMPREYFRINLDEWNANDYYMMLSIRQDAGKTTQSLLLGVILNKLYRKTTVYMRSDNAQLTRSNLETLYDVILTYDYIAKIFNNEWNGVIFKPMLKNFYLVKRDPEGNIVKQDDVALCVCKSLEHYSYYKSTFNMTQSDYLIFDEIMDTSRSTNRQMVELQHNISTFGRERKDVRLIMLGNNVNKYSFWFEEFCIEKDIDNLDFGGYIKNKTDLGTTLFCALLDLSDNKKKEIEKRHIRFSGFRTPKMNAFNGLGAWSGNVQPHIPDEQMLLNDYLINERIYIKHRGRYVKIKIYQNEDTNYCFLHYANKPILKDNIVLCVEPLEYGELYGWGKYAPPFVKDKLIQIIGMREQNKWYYATNSVGELIEDYFNEIR